ncbi:tyrosine-type recombinase/integrase [Micromonospora carbonacea]|nr:tyrosine-type recombinase/integrase [Micromonospora carbonacea]
MTYDVRQVPAAAGHRPATHRLRPDRHRLPTQDRRQPPHHRPGPHHRHHPAPPPPPTTHRAGRQLTEQTEHAGDWTDSGYVFAQPDGQPLHPDYLTRRFRRLVTDSALPPVRLHDLRHGAATLAHCAGADLKTVQEQLGHTSTVLTADTYTSALLDLHLTVAEATARLVLAAAARVPGRKHRTPTRHPRTAATPTARRPKPLPGNRIRREPHPGAGRAHMTPKRHPKIKAA